MRLASDTAAFGEVQAAVSAGLSAYNDGFLPSARERTPFALSLRSDDGAIRGGMTGEYRLDWLYIDLFWIDEALRGQGYGEKLLALAESEAKARGANHLVLWTWSFQAPDFYRHMGFAETGRYSDHPKGHDMIFLRKDL